MPAVWLDTDRHWRVSSGIILEGAMRLLDKYRSTIVWKLILPVPIMAIVGVLLVSFFLPKAIVNNSVEMAIENAKQTVNQFKTLRAYYTRNVIQN